MNKSVKTCWLPCPRWPFHKLCNIRRIILERRKAKSVPLSVCFFPLWTPPQLLLSVSEWSVIGSCGREETQFLLSCSSGQIIGLPVVDTCCRASLSSSWIDRCKTLLITKHLKLKMFKGMFKDFQEVVPALLLLRITGILTWYTIDPEVSQSKQ